MDRFWNDHSGDPVGTHADPNYYRINPEWTVRECREHLRLKRDESNINGQYFYLYTVDQDGNLCGVVSRLSLAEKFDDEKIKDISITDVITVKDSETVRNAGSFLYLSRLHAVPIVQGESMKMLGVFHFPIGPEQTVESVRADLQRMLDFDAAEIKRANLAKAFGIRWRALAVTKVAGLLCALAMAGFEDMAAKLPLLFAFIPSLLGLADAVSHQASSLAIVEHLGQSWNWNFIRRRFYKEFRESFSVGLVDGLVLLLFIIAWARDVKVGVIIGLSLLLSMTFGGLFGLLVPSMVRWFRRDPHISAGPIALALTDITATLALIGTTWLFIH